MDTVTKISAAPAAANNLFINAMAVACGVALLVFACIATNGLDMSVGFF